ncbi:ribose ABC transporter substrate-binding protein RbsB [Candidatus Fukatsuia symbiotica]|uniref:D-ribose ABC transporter substrate-binding protein RbsB n=1 Tax=Candidatus Fukatsuia symbiotica TaxID=1878942 RepID=A0A2U8I806_9GAMM|nr:ribose ABC transporter substrate-binding protein RbsB [Candidatus Fukatsuia symbiotica]AWK15233.1 D-ribose ABC transporter substrate-binding protein RbsB [Candidatus Fukatsuia symbiotica]MEA9444067.1 ribose ABC transporter substrate-binding protein RbsB [Candidatus Fukatsuia symbiotica]
MKINKWGTPILVVLSFIASTQVLAKDTIALVVPTLDNPCNPFFISMKEGAQKEADKLGYTLEVYDSRNNSATELLNVQSLTMRSDVKFLLISTVNSNAAGNSVKLANEVNIPVITLDRIAHGVTVKSHITSDNILGSKMAGDFIARKLGDGARVVQLEGIVVSSGVRERAEGFRQSVKQHKFNLLASQPAHYDRTDGMHVMQELLTLYPNIQAVFAQNDEMALGALQTLQNLKRMDVLVVGFDGTDEAVKTVKSGEMAATIAQQPEQIGAKGVEMADKVLKGEKIPDIILIGLKLVMSK